VEVVCDESGRGHLDIAVPPGRGKIKLLVSARWQGRERTRSLEVERSPRHELDLRVSDTAVVPGGKPMRRTSTARRFSKYTITCA
jgi:hypothetical protein